MEPIQIVSLILCVNGKYAVEQRELGRNIYGYGIGTVHAFPAGHVEEDEAPGEAIIREMEEELGIRMQDAIPVHSAPVTTDGANLRITWYVCTAFEGEPTNNEGQPLVWLAEDAVIRRMHHAGYDALLAAKKILQ